ncbi:MAG: hypothetical protein F6J93_17460 [Oscillatoria sp. SIO1A7]|nr:hypothetical protein [Oscillatoria sp. SIO1A7]
MGRHGERWGVWGEMGSVGRGGLCLILPTSLRLLPPPSHPSHTLTCSMPFGPMPNALSTVNLGKK